MSLIGTFPIILNDVYHYFRLLLPFTLCYIVCVDIVLYLYNNQKLEEEKNGCFKDS